MFQVRRLSAYQLSGRHNTLLCFLHWHYYLHHWSHTHHHYYAGLQVILHCFERFLFKITHIFHLSVCRKIRQKDATVYNIQLSIALLLMLVMALVLVVISSEAATVLYEGCVFISISVHYFTLVAVMWMAAAALLMFQKVVLVFIRITATQLVIVSLMCWCKCTVHTQSMM